MNRSVRVGIIALAIPVVVTLLAVAIALMSLPRLPERVIVHWGVNGADGYGSATGLVWLIAGTGPLVIAATGLFAVLPRRAPFTVSRKFLALMSVGVTSAVTGAMLVALIAQGPHAPLPGLLGWLVPAAVVLLTGIAALGLPPAVAWRARSSSPTPLVVGESERVSWVGEVRASGGIVIGLGALGVVLVGGGIALSVLSIPGGWVVLVVAIIIALSIASVASWTITVDERGLGVRSMLGVPRFRIPLDRIASVSVSASVSPLGDFGGWGVRFNGRRWAVLVRPGEALQVASIDGGGFVVTMPHAHSAAAALEGLVSARGGR